MRSSQARMLLACQQLRETRLQAERNRQTQAVSEARAKLIEADQLATAGETQDARELQRSYERLVGRSVDLATLLELREQEAEAVTRSDERRNVARQAAERLDEAEIEERAAADRSAEAVRRLAKRERVVERTEQDGRAEAILRENELTDASGLTSWLGRW